MCYITFRSVQSLSHVRFFASPWAVAHKVSLSNLETTPPTPGACSNSCPSTHNHLIFCRPLLLPPLVFSSIRVISSESVLHIRWPKYWSFSFSISPSSGYSGLISFRMDWFDLLAVQGTLKSLLQHHSSQIYINIYVYIYI